MYLSQLNLNPHNRRVQKELAQPYQMHRTLMRSFPDNLETPDDERVLFRVDIDRRTGGVTVLMQSFLRPTWGWLENSGAVGYLLGSPKTKSFENKLRDGQVLSFRLRANPTVKRQGKRYGLYKEEQQRDWLDRKAEQDGFKVQSVIVTQQPKIYSTVHRNGHSHRITMAAVRFDGTMAVRDADQLWGALQYGIGSGKSMGFGLLSLGPPR